MRLNAVAFASDGTGFRLQLSNGTSGAQIFQNTQNNVQPENATNSWVVYEGKNSKKIGTFELDQWYILKVVLGSTQQVYVDGALIFESETLSSNYCTSNSVINQASGGETSINGKTSDVDIEWIAFKAVS